VADTATTEHLLARARTGDGDAFRELVDPYRRELHVHCYRILGSVQDAEDLLQETLLAAWRGLDRFEGRASVRSWLYRIATNRCLNALRDTNRRPREQPAPAPTRPLPEPTHLIEPSWLEPYPDALLDGIPDTSPGPDARYQAKESISLAFIAAVQSLPPRQRAVLVLRDVLGFRGAEAADILGTSEDAVTSALKRARAVLAAGPRAGIPDHASLPGSPHERDLAARFAEAFEHGDTDAIVALLTDDVWLTMPPLPLAYQGRAAVRDFMSTVGCARRYRLIATRANGQPAYGCYLYDPHTPIAHAHGLLVLTTAGEQISAITRFLDNSVLPLFGLPRSLRE
jgi:RNA polymerase sigma-70 factor (TIGR02960 family)